MLILGQCHTSLLSSGHCLPHTHSPAVSRTLLRASESRTRSQRRFRLCTAATAVKELPIFPLSVVSFPGCHTPLNIFEARYRVLFNTLLAGEPGLEEDLIQREAKYVGSKQFGMCYVNQQGMCKVGTTLRISEHIRSADGRLAVQNKGFERFKILKVLQERPVLMALVEVLDEEDDGAAEMQDLANIVRQNFKDLLVLNARAKQKQPTSPPEELDTFRPRDVSFYIASLLIDAPLHQQVMLEEDSTRKRLEAQRELLTGTVGYMRARLALEGAFAAPDPSTEPSTETLPTEPSAETAAESITETAADASSTTSTTSTETESSTETVTGSPTESSLTRAPPIESSDPSAASESANPSAENADTPIDPGRVKEDSPANPPGTSEASGEQ